MATTSLLQGSVNWIPPQADYGIATELAFRSTVFLGIFRQQERLGPLWSSQQLLVCYLALWHEQTSPPALAWVSSGRQQCAECHGTKIPAAHWAWQQPDSKGKVKNRKPFVKYLFQEISQVGSQHMRGRAPSDSWAHLLHTSPQMVRCPQQPMILAPVFTKLIV